MAKKVQRNSPWATFLFLCYAALMIYLLFIRGRGASEGLPYWEQIRKNCNFVPWHTVGNYWDVLTRPEYYTQKWGNGALYARQAEIAVVNIIGNVAVFLPLGVFLPTVWYGLQKMWKAIPMGFLMILGIETVQLLTLRGRFDVDDISLNVIGIATGYFVWRLVKTMRKKKK